MSNNKKRSDSLASWIFPIFMLMVAPPIGFIFLLLKLLDGRKTAKTRTRHPYYTQKETQGHVGARTTAPTRAAASSPREGELKKLDQKGKRLVIIGAVLAILFGLGASVSVSEALYWLVEGEFTWFLQDLSSALPALCFAGGGLGCLWAGLRKRKQARKFRKYLAMIGQQKSISLSTLASATGRSVREVRDDLEDMLDADLFPQGFLDYGGDRLVLSGSGLTDQAPPRPTATRTEENAILAEIRAVNDAIHNEKLSAQIDRIGVITAKILDYQKSHPEKAPQLHSFLSYYLPTTLKILRAYAQLEAQGVEGQNITAAMQRIEGMMDKVVEGFETQLDVLFQGDAMDITTDVEVLERMLRKDGLSGQQEGMTLNL